MPLDKLCPDSERVVKLAIGDLPEEELDAICNHVSGCDRCTTILRNLSDEPTELPFEMLNQSSWFNDAEDRDAVERLIVQWRDFSIKFRHPKFKLPGLLSEDSSDNVDGVATEVGTKVSYEELAERLLQPPRVDGELGWLGPYRMLSVLGAGGMGVVFEGEDPDLGRRVAVKAMQPNLLGSTEHKQRFLREARTVASVDHDNIVPIHHVSEDNGVPYLVMPLLKGESLESKLRREGRMSILDVVDIGKQIACGIAAAHKVGLIHRDIKPANIWLEDRGEQTPRVKLLDFGLARNEADESQLTRTGTVAGTPAFMSPEQVRGDATGARSDLFSLGCVLYYMISGRPPFTGRNSTSVMFAIVNDQPTSLIRVYPDIPRSLDSLVTDLLEKDCAKRVSQAQDVVHALERIASESPNSTASKVASPSTQTLSALASVPSALANDLVTNSSKRYAVGWGAGITALCLMFLGVAYFMGWLLKVETPQGTIVLKVASHEVEGASVYVDDKQRVTIESNADVEALKIEVDPGTHMLKVTKPGFEIFTREFSLAAGKKERIDVRLEPNAVAKTPRAAADTVSRTGVFRDLPLPGLVPHPAKIAGLRRWQIETLAPRGDLFAVAWDHDGNRVACSSPTGNIRIIDVKTSTTLSIFPAHSGPVWAIDWSPASDLIVTAGEDGAVRLIDSQGVLQRELGSHGATARSVAFNRDGSWIASGGNDSKVRLWRTTGEAGPVLSGHGSQVDGVAWHPSSKKLASASLDGSIRIWDLSSSWNASGIQGQEMKGHLGGVLGLAWSPDGVLLASAGVDGTVLLSKSDGTSHSVLGSHGNVVTAIAWSSGGLVATAGDDRTVRLWQPDGTQVSSQTVETRINDLEWSNDGNRLALGTGIDGMRFMNSSGDWDGDIANAEISMRDVAFSTSGQVAVVGDKGLVEVWNADGSRSALLQGPSGMVSSVMWNSLGNQLIAASHQSPIYIWDLESGTSSTRAGTAPAAWSSRGDQIAWADGSNIQLEALGSGVQVLRGHQSNVSEVAWSADGSLLASADASGEMRIWNRNGTQTAMVKTDMTILALAWHPTQPLLTVGNLGNGAIQIWSVDGNLIKTWNAHAKAVVALDWNSSGDRLLSSSYDQNIHIWNMDGKQIGSLPGPMSIAFGVAWSADDKRIASAHIDGCVRIWDASTLEPETTSINLVDGNWVKFDSSGPASSRDSNIYDSRFAVIAEDESGAIKTMKPSELQGLKASR